MPVTFCPSEVAWGDVASWVGVLVSACAALATMAVAILALRTSRQAKDISTEATRIAESQWQEMQRQREQTTQVVANLIIREVVAYPAHASTVLYRLMEAIDWNNAGVMPDAQKLELAFAQCQQSMLPATSKVFELLHNLPDEVGEEVAKLLGCALSAEQMGKDHYSVVAMIKRREVSAAFAKEGLKHLMHQCFQATHVAMVAGRILSPICHAKPVDYTPPLKVLRLAEQRMPELAEIREESE